ncbi:hypothetical protein [Salinarimonas sp.]|uniref:hypothetical protein n=1 Tax=Salinarimonas sp. TaxID=2766526 RepID=UPI00391A96AA
MAFDETAQIHIEAGTPVFYVHEVDSGFELRTIAFQRATSQHAETLSKHLASEDEAIAFCMTHPSAETSMIVITTVRSDGGVTLRSFRKAA